MLKKWCIAIALAGVFFTFQNCGKSSNSIASAPVKDLGDLDPDLVEPTPDPIPEPEPDPEPIPDPTPDPTSCKDNKKLLKVGSLFQKNMVLHETQPRVWGTGRPQEEVTVSLKGREGSSVKTKVDHRGNWEVEIPSAKMKSGSSSIIVKDVCETVKVDNILIGEVWLCSGQSNMSFTVDKSTSRAEILADIKKAEIKNNIRFFNVSRDKAQSPQAEIHPIAKYPYNNKWVVPSANSVTPFSAVCYHMGKTLQTKLNKPIGLINSSYGGTKIQLHIPESELPAKYKVGAETSAVYNAMIAPLIPMKLSGVAWYQGEANLSQPFYYNDLAKLLFQSWRKKFEIPKLPVVIVQLANLGKIQVLTPGKADAPTNLDKNWSSLRQQQYLAAANDPLVWMVTAIDGATKAEAVKPDIHPKNKKKIGVRLGRMALTQIYKVTTDNFPRWVPNSIKKSEAYIMVPLKVPGKVTLPSLNTVIKGFTLRNSGSKIFYHASNAWVRSVDPKERVVWVKMYAKPLKNPVEIRYAYASSPTVGYAIKETGDPLVPFCARLESNKWQLCDDSKNP